MQHPAGLRVVSRGSGKDPGAKTTPGARGSVPYGQDGAVCIAHDIVSKVPRNVGLRLNMSRAVQAQNDEIGFESMGSQQDLFTRHPVLDHKLRLECHLGILQIQFLELPLASQSRLISDLREIAGG